MRVQLNGQILYYVNTRVIDPSVSFTLPINPFPSGGESVTSIVFKSDLSDPTDTLPNAMLNIAVNDIDEEKPATDPSEMDLRTF